MPKVVEFNPFNRFALASKLQLFPPALQLLLLYTEEILVISKALVKRFQIGKDLVSSKGALISWLTSPVTLINGSAFGNDSVSGDDPGTDSSSVSNFVSW
jgi:hypothetical protein